MPDLIGLENTRKVRKAYSARSASSAIAQLRKGRAVTTADDFGCVTAWRGFDKKYRVEAQRWMQTVDKQTFDSLTATGKWYAEWLKKIAERPD